jgi:hypothetical protein
MQTACVAPRYPHPTTVIRGFIPCSSVVLTDPGSQRGDESTPDG